MELQARIQTPPEPRSKLWLKRLLKWGTPTLAATLLVGYLWPLGGVQDMRCGSIGDGLYSVDGECVGVTDGSFLFDSQFRAIQEDIKAENDRVAQQVEQQGEPAVKIAMLSTLTVDDASPLDQEQIRNALEGAYVAQHRANHTNDFRDPQPLIQLYLANEGSVQQGWDRVVGQLERMTDDDVPLAAVMGQSISTVRTTEAAKRLSAAGIPMVTATTTADGLDYDSVRGMLRAGPSNTDFAEAFRHYLDNQDELESGVLVFDNNTDDTFAATLREAFETKLGDYIQFSHQPFPGGSVEQGGPMVFSTVTENICTAGPDMVHFAGRAPDLEAFLEALESRICVDEHLTVLFAEIGMYERGGDTVLEDGNLTLLHAAGYDPAWAHGAADAPAGFESFHSHFESLVGHDAEALDNGFAVNNHDSMAAAVCAVRITNPWDAEAPKPTDVREHLLLLNEQNEVRGATGTLTFDSNRAGNPGGKHIPVYPVPYPADYEPSEPYITPTE